MPTAVLSPAEDLIFMIASSDLLSDQQKHLFIGELMEGRLHPELESMIDTIVARESELATIEATYAERDLALNAELLARAEEEANAEAPALLAEYEQGLQTIISDHNNVCRSAELELEKTVERSVRTHKDDSEADAIRKMLQQKPA